MQATLIYVNGVPEVSRPMNEEKHGMKVTGKTIIARLCWIVFVAAAMTATFPKPCFAQDRQFQSLNGTWKIVFDPRNEGQDEGWLRKDRFPSARQRDIQVPSCWELTERDYEGVAFYNHAFQVSKDWRGKTVRLHFDAVNFRAEVWVNGTAVGVHEGGFTPFEFRVEDLLNFDGENRLAVRVAGPILLQDKRIDGIGPMETPQWRGAITGGIWQSVRLIATNELYVKDVFVVPKISNDTADLHVDLVHSGRHSLNAHIDLMIRSNEHPEQIVAESHEVLKVLPGRNRHRQRLVIPSAKYWSPAHPNLYRAEVSVALDGEISDRWSTRFGMREFTVRDKRFYLNGEPLYLKATFFEGLYPVKLAYPDSREMAVREIQLAKKAGFNMIRPWRKPPPPMWLDLADEMGVLTVGSLAVECMDYPVESANLPRWVENEVRQSILRDRNRACIVQWELFNELKRPVLKRMLHPMALLARSLDPTRLILDESGGWAQGANLFLPYDVEPTKFNDIHHYPGQKINDEIFQKLMLTGSVTHEEMRKMGLGGALPGRNVVPGLMTFFSELGYGSMPDLEDNNLQFSRVGNPLAPTTVYHRRLEEQTRTALKASGFAKLYPGLKRFCLDQQVIHGTANRRMIEAVRCNPKVAGYCIHALVAGDWILGAGLLDLFRNPKTYAYEGTRAANAQQILSIRVRPRNVYAARGTRITVAGVNERTGINGKLQVSITDSTGNAVFTKSVEADLDTGISSLFDHALDTTSLAGSYTVATEFSGRDGSVIAKNEYAFDVFTPQQLTVPRRSIAVLDPVNSLTPFLKRAGIEFVEFGDNTDPSITVFVSRMVANSPDQRKRFAALSEFIRKGGMAVYLQAGGPKVQWGAPGSASKLLPFKARLKRAGGYWMCIPRLVQDHPLLEGLPTDCMMGEIYENVWSQSSLIDVQGTIVAGTIGYDWFPDYDLSRRHYYGPGDVWWGSDLAIVPVEQGQCIVSQLRLVENLGKDPVADKILMNLIKFTGR